MEKKADLASSNDNEPEVKSELPTADNCPQRETCLGFYSLSENLRHMVVAYLSSDPKDPARFALLGEQRITLCLSQSANSKFGSCWHFGCLSSDDEWESSKEVIVDKRLLFNDYQGCLDLFSRERSPYYAVVVEVLLVLLDVSSQNFSSALDDLQNVLTIPQDHLSCVKHVVLVVDEHVFCCFSFKDIIDNATAIRQAVDRLLALKQILDDLRTCWRNNHSLSPKLLLDYYILSDSKPKSDLYLSKFVVSLNHWRHRDLFDAVDPPLNSSNLKWLYYLETLAEVKNFDQKMANCCHAFCLNTSKTDEGRGLLRSAPTTFCFADNPFIERIVIDSSIYSYAMSLPRPSAPLIDATPRSALIEVSLKGKKNVLDLAELNSGYFSHLVHVCITDGMVKGHLVSQRVPSLRTLKIDLRGPTYKTETTESWITDIHNRTQSLIQSGYPWQLVAAPDKGGWSLASYGEHTSNPQDEVKERSYRSPSHSLPHIKELILVLDSLGSIDEWQLLLNGNHSQEAIEGDHKDDLLVWSPDRVESIAAFCTSFLHPRLQFDEVIPGRTHILKSLTCCGIVAVFNGDVLPNLETLHLDRVEITFSGAFLRMQTLSIKNSTLKLPWQLDAPMLRSFSCVLNDNGRLLTIIPALLPHLSYLWIKGWGQNHSYYPTILADEGRLGLSRINHVVLDMEITFSHSSDQGQINYVSHLELELDPMESPAWWHGTVWQCETLKVDFHVGNLLRPRKNGMNVLIVSPLLPRVKTLMVTEFNSLVLLDSVLPELTHFTVASPKSFGENFKCPALRSICFTGKLSASDREKCLDRTTYSALGATPMWVYFAESGEVKRMSWDVAPRATGESSLEGPFEKVD